MTEAVESVPADVRLVRDFVNTLEPQVGHEELQTPAQLRDWLAERGLVGPRSRFTDPDLDLVRRVREGLRAVLMAHAGHESDRAALAGLNAALERVQLRVAFGPDGARRLAAATPDDLHGALAGLLTAIDRAERDQSWERLKVCARDTCRWAFYDASRNRSGRWCSMAGCGNHVKMKRAYAARKARDPA